MTLKQQLQEALGLPDSDFDRYANDLYVRATPAVIQWLKQNYPHWTCVTAFPSDHPEDKLSPELDALGVRVYWLDIPFAAGEGKHE